MKKLRLGMIGLDTSYCPAFAELLNNEDYPHYTEGGEIVVAYPGGSQAFFLKPGAGRSDYLGDERQVQNWALFQSYVMVVVFVNLFCILK